MRGKGVGFVALALGIVGLLTGGLLVLGSMLGLGLGIVALVLARRQGAATDVSWAAITANVFALASAVPLAFLLVGLWPMLFPPEERLPEPIAETYSIFVEPLAPPDPPPPPPPPHPSLLSVREVPTSGDVSPVRVGGNIRMPRRLTYVSPAYPEIAKEARVQGVVILECTISAEGNVTDVTVLRGIPLLDEAAIQAVRQWRYAPTLLNGQAVPVIMTMTVNFRLR
jgi:TonB family protein